MATVRIVGNILNTTNVTRYSSSDTNLITSRQLQENFGGSGDYIEYHLSDIGNNPLYSTYDYRDYSFPTTTVNLTPGVSYPPNTTGNIQTNNVGIDSTLSSSTGSYYPVITIDPVNDIQSLGFSSGEYKVQYNFFTNILSNNIDRDLFVKEISSDRTEIRLASTTLSNNEIESAANLMINEMNNSTYYVDYLLNFGDNKIYVAVNVALNRASEGYEILFKLYNPLPLEVQIKQTLWIVEEKVVPYVFDINLDKSIIPDPPTYLRGPNFDIAINTNQGTVASSYSTYSSLVSNLQSLQNSSYNQILNLLATQSANINVDYTDFSDFVFFGSAYQRLVNFYGKVKEIEDYNNFINSNSPLTSSIPSLITEINQYSASINDVVSKLDGYESYLYFESSSYAWPKSGVNRPYSLLSTGSATVLSWYNSLTSSAQTYDSNNYNNLEYAVPEFLRNDDNNQPFLTFLNMVGQYFDNIWIYLKAITDINLANNNLDYGISRDLVYDRLRSLGVYLYNSQAGDNVDQYLIGANTGSSVWNNDTSVTSSYLNNIPRKDLVSEVYKRIYHNLPLLLKTKGTVTGLQHLITTFGLTSSILNVKEYGGSLKSNLINGYNNDKVRIIPNSIVSNTIYSGSVLSSFHSLQTFPTASNEFRENDDHYVDISFSPQTQIDTYISGAIASNNPTWSLDDYIGDPRQQYLTTYPDLDAQRKLYFETGVPGFAPFTASLLDYNGFIRLVEYFDNSLFKMLEDFVPERASLSTGVTINSPVLERNKTTYANPTTTTTQSVYDADYNIATISSSYGTFYNALSSSNNTMGWFDGELSGSVVDINQYFEDNYNPYLLGDTASYNSRYPANQQVNYNTFLHSDWNVLLNNVSSSVESIYRNYIEYVWGTTGSILTPAELQDSYLSLRSYNTSRYEGVKTTSLLYNTYTPPSGSYGGDQSYGKTAALDHTVRKIGLFTQIESSSLLPKRSNVRLKYLVDEFGELTELNQINNNWYDVQRTFIMGDTASISLFDNKKFSNQKSTDGNKLIFDSGYTYTPILYGSGNDNRLYFENTTNNSTYYAKSINLSSSYFISGSPNPSFPVVSGYVQNLFNNVIQNDGNMYAGNGSNFPSYSIAEGGGYDVSAALDITLLMQSAGSSSFTLQAYSGSTLLFSDQQTFEFSSTALIPTGYTGYLSTTSGFVYGTLVVSVRPITIGGITRPAGTSFYQYSGLYRTNTSCTLSDLLTSAYSLLPSIQLNVDPCTGIKSTKFPVYDIPLFNIPEAGNPITKTFGINLTRQTFTQGSQIILNLSQSYTTTANYTASISQGSFIVSSTATALGTYPYVAITNQYFDDEMWDYNYAAFEDEIILSPGLANFYSPNYQYLPTIVSGSAVYSSSLYSDYGDVDYPFQLNTYDIFAAYDNSGSYFESRILYVYRDANLGNFIRIKLDDTIPFTLRQQLTRLTSPTSNRVVKFIFIKRVEDETSAYLNFAKRPGLTSYGFMIPENLNKDVLANINTITSQVKMKLLNDQGSIITDINGGGF